MSQKHVKLTKVAAEGLVCTQKLLASYYRKNDKQIEGETSVVGSAEAFLSRRHLAGRSTSPEFATNAYDLHPGRAPALEQLSEHGCNRRHRMSII